MKKVTIKEAIDILSEVGSNANVEVFISSEYGEKQSRVVLNDGFCYNPFYKKSIGGRNSSANAETAMNFILSTKDRQMKVYSSYYSWATGTYQIV